MVYVGIDISKYKHDAFICNDTGEVIVENISFENNKKGFQQFNDLLKPYESSNVHIGLEATGHYGMNLKLFLEKNNLTFMEFNPSLVKEFIKSQTLRKTKTDKADAYSICQKLMSIPYKPNSPRLYHMYSLKSLSRTRNFFVKERSKCLVAITNVLDHTFPEFKPFFGNKLSSTAIFILEKYNNIDKISRMKDYNSISMKSRGKFTYAKFANLKVLAKDTVGESNDILEFQMQTFINLYKNLVSQIKEVESKISTIIKELNPQSLSIPGIGEISCAAILSEYGDISNFSSPAKMLAFAGCEPSVIQSGIQQSNGKMVKHGSSNLRYHLLQASRIVIRYNPVFYDYYLAKRSEGKSFNIAISHVAKKLIRIIYHLETNNVKFDSSLLK